MDKASLIAHPQRRVSGARGIAFALSLILGLSAGSASAQWLVHDPGNAVINGDGFASQLAKTVEQYVMQAQQYATQLQQYQNMLTSFTELGSNISIVPQKMALSRFVWLIFTYASDGPGAATGSSASA